MSAWTTPNEASASTTEDGKITFHVDVTDFKDTRGAIEISGQATQVNGAFASIYAIVEVPSNPNGDLDDPEEHDRYFTDVEASPNPEQPFEEDADVTVFVRVSKAWLTVLGPGTAEPQELGKGQGVAVAPTWGVVKATTMGWSSGQYGGQLPPPNGEDLLIAESGEGRHNSAHS